MHSRAKLLPLVLEHVTLLAGARRIIDDVSLTLDAGPRTVIVGPNGAGKSVLLRLCHGLLQPSHGEVKWHAGEIAGAPRRQAMVFQRPVMLRRSAFGNVDYVLRMSGMLARERRERTLEALQRVGLRALAESPARVLSGGEQQRLALARAWVLQPEVLFLDEPTASLDPGATQAIEAIIQAMHAEGAKIVMVTHNLGQARRMGDEILFMHAGRITERAPSDRFFVHPASTEAAQFIAGELPWH